MWIHQLCSWFASLNMLLLCLFESVPVQHLDISDDKQFTSDVARQLLGQPGILPALVSLDVSGRKQVIETRPTLIHVVVRLLWIIKLKLWNVSGDGRSGEGVCGGEAGDDLCGSSGHRRRVF